MFHLGKSNKDTQCNTSLRKSCARCTHQTPSSLECSLSSCRLALLSLILSEEIVGQVVVFTQQSACQFAGMQPVEARRRAGRITFDPSLKEEKMSSELALESWRIVLVWFESENGARKIMRWHFSYWQTTVRILGLNMQTLLSWQLWKRTAQDEKYIRRNYMRLL
jgi:hypothetical protein